MTQLHWHILIQPPFFGITDSDIYIYILITIYYILYIYNYIHISIYHLVMTNSSPWKIPSINGGLVCWENHLFRLGLWPAMASMAITDHQVPGPQGPQVSNVCNGEIWRKCCGPAVPTSRSCQQRLFLVVSASAFFCY